MQLLLEIDFNIQAFKYTYLIYISMTPSSYFLHLDWITMKRNLMRMG